ncbi:MAG: hypothetical protein R3B67_10050 [Phycisphaerales bacterium]
MQTPMGEFNLIAFRSMVDPMPHSPRHRRRCRPARRPRPSNRKRRAHLVRVHRGADLLGDIFDDLDSGSDHDLHRAHPASVHEMIQDAGRGAIVYLRPTARGRRLVAASAAPSTTTPTTSPSNPCPWPCSRSAPAPRSWRAPRSRDLKLITNSDTSTRSSRPSGCGSPNGWRSAIDRVQQPPRTASMNLHTSK